MIEDYDVLFDFYEEFLYDICNIIIFLDKIDIYKFILYNYGGELYIVVGYDWNLFNYVIFRLLELRKEIDLDLYIEISDYSYYNELIEIFLYVFDYYEN